MVPCTIYKYHKYAICTLIYIFTTYKLNGAVLPVENFFFSLCHLQATHECPQKVSAYSVQPFGRLKGTYIQMLLKQNIKESEDAIPSYYHSLTRVYLIHNGTQFKPLSDNGWIIYLLFFGKLLIVLLFLWKTTCGFMQQWQCKTFSRGPFKFPIKIVGKLVLGYLSYDQASKQTNRDNSILYF